VSGAAMILTPERAVAKFQFSFSVKDARKASPLRALVWGKPRGGLGSDYLFLCDPIQYNVYVAHIKG